MPRGRTSSRRTSSRSSSSRRTSSSSRRLDGFREGDRIRVFSAGNQINGTGTFIRVRDGFLTWVDSSGNVTTTSLDVISVSKR